MVGGIDRQFVQKIRVVLNSVEASKQQQRLLSVLTFWHCPKRQSYYLMMESLITF